MSLEPNFCIIVKYAHKSFYHYVISIVLFKVRVNNNSGGCADSYGNCRLQTTRILFTWSFDPAGLVAMIKKYSCAQVYKILAVIQAGLFPRGTYGKCMGIVKSGPVLFMGVFAYRGYTRAA